VERLLADFSAVYLGSECSSWRWRRWCQPSGRRLFRENQQGVVALEIVRGFSRPESPRRLRFMGNGWQTSRPRFQEQLQSVEHSAVLKPGDLLLMALRQGSGFLAGSCGSARFRPCRTRRSPPCGAQSR